MAIFTCGWRIVISPMIPQDSPSCYAFCDAQSVRSFHPLDRHLGPVARSWRRPFPSCGVPSPQAPAPNRESFSATIAESIRVGPRPCRLDGALGASNSSAPFRNYTEALDTASPSQSHEQTKVPDAVHPETSSEARERLADSNGNGDRSSGCSARGWEGVHSLWERHRTRT